MNPEEITIPFALAEQPRIFLKWLAGHSTLPEATRERIAEWLGDHKQKLGTYLISQYSQAAMYAADDLSRRLSAEFEQTVLRDVRQANQDMFDRLEDELS